MQQNYIKRSIMLLGAAAVLSTAANAGAWRDVTYQMKNPAFIPGWQGGITATADGVGEIYNGAFNLYQSLPDMPAGEYTLTVTAFYRYANNDLSKANMKGGANHNAYIYINGQKKAVEGLFDNTDTAPNSTGEANAAFEAGQYLNTVTVNHPGGDMLVGIANPGGEWDEWCCFDNFKLTGPNGDVTAKIKNADFAEGMDTSTGLGKNGWNFDNIKYEQKGLQVNKWGYALAKTNASAYNYGQLIENLPAGKYRFSALSFYRDGAGNTAGKYYAIKGEWAEVSGESAYDRHVNGTEENHAVVYAYKDNKAAYDAEGNFDKIADPAEFTAENNYKETTIKCIFDLQGVAVLPDNEPNAEQYAAGHGWGESGMERQSSALFVTNPEAVKNVVEFEVAAGDKVVVGLALHKKSTNFAWHPFADFKLEMWDESKTSAIDDVVVDDENAPVVYYNLQGVQVANPENGLYIKKQGKKVSKVVF